MKCKIRCCNNRSDGTRKNRLKIGLCNKHYLRFKNNKPLLKSIFDKNKYIKHGDKYIMELTNNKYEIIGKAIIDLTDINICKMYKWRLYTGGYVHNNTVGSLHRFVLGLNKNNPEVDHINRNKLDNRKNNLRISNRIENCRNCKIHKNNTSGNRGVHKSGNLWITRIGNNNSRITKYSKTKKEAIQKRKELEIKYWRN